MSTSNKWAGYFDDDNSPKTPNDNDKVIKEKEDELFKKAKAIYNSLIDPSLEKI